MRPLLMTIRIKCTDNHPNKKPPQNITAETSPYCMCLDGLDARVVLVAVIAGEYLTVSLCSHAGLVNDHGQVTSPLSVFRSRDNARVFNLKPLEMGGSSVDRAQPCEG